MNNKVLKKILYVEDEEDIRVVAKLALVDVGGFDLKCCSLGQEALDIVEDYQPDLIILDVMMPDMDGPTTMKAMQKMQSIKLVPIVFVTARSQPDELSEYIKMGAIDVITKPFDPMKIADKIKSIWERVNE